MSQISDYQQQLADLSSFLKSVRQEIWAERLSKWIVESRSLTDTLMLTKHLERTKKALVGMGSVGDFVVTAQNAGINFSSAAELKSLNEKKDLLVENLYLTTKKLLESKA